MLDNASVGSCQALVVVSTDDVTNLQAALNGRALNSRVRVVLRLFDGDFAERIQKAFDIGISRSVSYLAAPAFTAALLNRAVIATLPIDRQVLLVAEVPIAAGSAFIGRKVGTISQPECFRLIALTRAGQPRLNWSPAPDTRLAAGDRLTVVVQRSELSPLLTRAGTPLPDRPALPRQSRRPQPPAPEAP